MVRPENLGREVINGLMMLASGTAPNGQNQYHTETLLIILPQNAYLGGGEIICKT
jgi:hypothetical protein